MSNIEMVKLVMPSWQPTPVFLLGESQGTGKPGGLSSMGSHRVGHDWSNLAVAVAVYSLVQNVMQARILMIEENAYIITLSEETRQRPIYVVCS